MTRRHLTPEEKAHGLDINGRGDVFQRRLVKITEHQRYRLWRLAQLKYGWAYANGHIDLRSFEGLKRRGLVCRVESRDSAFELTDKGAEQVAMRWPVSPFVLKTYEHQPGGWTPVEGVDPLMSRVEVDESGCWVWTGARIANEKYPYGVVTQGGKRRGAHRVFYERFIGPIPDGLVLDHLCENPPCVNPAHLEPVTNSVNLDRGNPPNVVHREKTHCIHGHEFTPENTYRWKGLRSCRTCAARRNRERRQEGQRAA
jgi:hypothetical protein